MSAHPAVLRQLEIGMRQAPQRTHGVGASPSLTRSRIVTLRDGRVMGYRLYGSQNGVPVIALHGTPGSRYKFASAHVAGLKHGLKIVSVDRWGYGLTSPRPGGTLRDFASDIANLADELAIGRYHVVGISGGGPFAAAVAASYAERVTTLALISPVGPIAGLKPLPALSTFHRLCFRTLPNVPGALSLGFLAFRLALRVSPPLALRLANTRSGVDRQTVADPAVRDRLAKTFREGMEPGVGGALADMALFARPWGIDLSRADMPSRMWIGLADRNVPIEAARLLARSLPRCELTEIPGAGHLWASHNVGEVMAWIASVGKA